MNLYNQQILGEIKDELKARCQTVSVAESVTSGHLQAAFSQASDAMEIFQGGITTYNLGQKARQLGVDPIHAQRCNSVSDGVTVQMARGIVGRFSSDWGIACTGYASPVPELKIDRIFAHYAFCFRSALLTQGKIPGPDLTDPFDVQVYYSNEILKQFLLALR